MTKKKKIILAICAAVLVALLVWGAWENTALVLTRYTVQSPDIPAAFDGFRIAQISDLHNTEFGKDNEKLLAMLRTAQPDIIAITGDLYDSRRTNISAALDFVKQAMEIAPCYYVTGNHEERSEEDYALLKAGLLELGVVVLENEKVEYHRDGETIHLLGVLDPAFEADYWRVMEEDVLNEHLPNLQSEGFTVLLSHRPEYMDLYARYDFDLVLTGHAHGGQFRLPFLGGLYAPGQGLFPQYDEGIFEESGTQMVVSRGLGNSIIPLRFNNRPEMVLITLNPQ